MRIKAADRNNIQEYYFSRKLKEMAKLSEIGLPVINLGIGNPDQAPSDETISKLVETSKLKNVHGYQSYVGIPELRNSFAKWYSKYFKVELNPENEILPLIGSKEGIMHISMAFLNPGDEVLIPDPGYPAYSALTSIAGGKVVKYNLIEKNNWLPDFDELQKLDLSKVKIMWVNYPHMPTGALGNEKLFSDLVEFGLKNNILICHDNPYSFILNENPMSIFSAKNSKEICLELNSLSKSQNMAGWRVGMLAGNADYVKAVVQIKSNVDSGMFRPLQLAAAEALKADFDWYENINIVYKKRREFAYEILDLIGCEYSKDQVGLFLWARIPEKYNSAEEIADAILYEAKVFITPGIIFGENGKKYLRISLCSSEELLREAINRIVKSNVLNK